MARREPEGPPAAPIVQRLRVQYAKRGRMRFTSTRDFQRALERAVRIARVPMAFSAGFHPHPRIAYAGAAPTGAASEAEFVELGLAERVDPSHLVAPIDAGLPDGLDVLDIRDAADAGGVALADLLTHSRWALDHEEDETLDLDRWRDLAARLLAEDSRIVSRMMKNGPRDIDVRAALVSLDVRRAPAGGARVEALVQHTTPTVRPPEIGAALADLASRPLPGVRHLRLAQGRLVDGEVRGPFEP